jgi:hypothetical protein
MEFVDIQSNTKLQAAFVMVLSFFGYLYFTKNERGADVVADLKFEAKNKLKLLGPFKPLNEKLV